MLSTLLAFGVSLSPGVTPCDHRSIDPWVSDLRDRVERYDGLAAFARERFGPPVECDGEVTTEFDGRTYGRLRLGYPGGVVLAVETMPIETSVVVLGDPEGFDSEDAVLEAMKSYATGRGLSIDWDAPEVVTEGDEVRRTFRDPESGLNASVTTTRRAGRLVAVRLSMAL